MMRGMLELMEEAGDSVKKGAQFYFFFFLIILFLTLASSVASTSLGIMYNSKWIIMVGGIARFVGTIILFALASVIVVPASKVFGGDSLGSFIARAKGVCFAELLVTLFILIFLEKIRGNLSLLPILVVIFLMLYAGSGILTKEIVNPLLLIVFGLVILNLIFPTRFEAFFRRLEIFDRTGIMEKLNPSAEEIQEKDFSFIDPKTGESLRYYIINPETDRVELYDYPGVIQPYMIRAELVDSGIMKRYLREQGITEDDETRTGNLFSFGKKMFNNFLSR